MADSNISLARILSMALELSIVIPVYNERENLAPLLAEIREALKNRAYEVVFVDDGSMDGSNDELRRLAEKNPEVRVVTLARNYGQTPALAAGFKIAQSDVIIPMDADGQNDPRDIPALLAKLDEGYQVVSGWRSPRRDPFLSRRIPSAIANKLIAIVTRLPLHDFGCTLKAYRRTFSSVVPSFW